MRRCLPFAHHSSILIHLQIEAIHALTSVGIVHRDIKPDNILVNPTTLEIKLIDYGLACFLHDGERSTSSAWVGTPLYMSPQILAGKDAYHPVAADIWSTGMVVLELLRGAYPVNHERIRNPEELLQALPAALKFDAYSDRTQRILKGLLGRAEVMRFSLGQAIRVFKRHRAPSTTKLTSSM